MAVKNLPVEVNSFIGGLLTEASPLTFPENASLDEANFILLRDGSRRRRLGMEIKTPEVDTGFDTIAGASISTYQWENVAGIAGKFFIVCQVKNKLIFFNIVAGQAVPEFHSELNINDFAQIDSTGSDESDMTSVDGVLVVTIGQRDILSITYNKQSDNFTPSKFNLKVRDLFGVQAPYSRPETTLSTGAVLPARVFDDLLTDQNSSIRPFTLTYEHTYNLRNQSWGRLREAIKINEDRQDTVLRDDPIESFNLAFKVEEDIDFFPSNSDSVATGIIDYVELKGAPERFAPLELGKTSRASSSAAKGFFIIDALNRGASRFEEAEKMFEEGIGLDGFTYDLPPVAAGEITSQPLRVPSDFTPLGAKCVEEFAGRAWYGGFSSEVFQGDKRSPRMGSYVLFSQLVNDLSNLPNCYQKNDPTYELEADLLATDGGFIRLDGAYGIKRFANLGSNLIVFATNGIWSVSGGTDQGFTAEAYIVRKISDQGIVSPKSVITINNTCMFWGEDGIYSIAPDQFGNYQSQNISKATIQKKYESIPLEQRQKAYGIYDKYENTARWVYGAKTLGSNSYELIFNVDLSAFSITDVKPVDATSPILLAPVNVPPFRLGTSSEDVVIGAENVTVLTEQVTVAESVELTGQRETFYLTLYSEGTTKICFSSYSDLDYLDWKAYDGIGVDAEAFLITGYGPQGDFQRRKQVPYITNYLLRTEDGFEEVSGDIVPKKQSSCLLQARWEWANSPNGNKWGRSFETYRYNRFYMPEDIDDTYDTGDEVLVTKNKLRGHGRTLSLKYSTSPKKDCRLLGWSMIVGVSTSV